MASKKLVRRILQQYGLDARIIADVQTGYRSESHAVMLEDGTTVNLILYKREPDIIRRIHNANRIGDYLATKDMPTRQTLDPRIIRLHNASTDAYGALYCYLPGETIPWDAYTKEHLKNVGGTLSTMHAQLRSLARQDLPSVTSEYLAIFGRIRTYFSRDGVQSAMRNKLQLQPPDVTTYIDLLEQFESADEQALHMDFVRGNILFLPNSAEISGIIDFEKTAWGPPVFDIARTLAFLLVDCKYKTPHQVRRYFMDSGYNKRGRGRFHEYAMLKKLLDAFLLHDFYKFLLHNPYESLHTNEHYRRTVALLQARDILDRP